MLNIYQATHRAIIEAFDVGWQGMTPVKYENRPFRRPFSPWVEIEVGWRSDIELDVRTDWRNQVGGVIYFRAHVSPGEGEIAAMKFAESASDILAHRQFRCENVIVKTFNGHIGKVILDGDMRLPCKCQFIGEFAKAN